MAKDETRGSLMLKKLRLCGIIALLGTTTILSLDYLTREYHARVIEVTDGDTIKVKMGIIWTVVEKISASGQIPGVNVGVSYALPASLISCLKIPDFV